MAKGLGDVATTLAGRITNQFLAALLLLVVVMAVVAIKVAGFTVYVLVVLAVVLFAVLLLRFGVRDADKPGTGGPPSDTYTFAKELDANKKENICLSLANAAQVAAHKLGVPDAHVRANVWGLGSDKRLRIVAELTHNMRRPEEMTLSMQVGQGVVGLCFQQRRPLIARYDEGWGEFVLPDSEEAKVDPAVRWVIALPVSNAAEERPMWIMTVDGLHDERSAGRLGDALGELLIAGGTLYLIATKEAL
jgi:hypothetical protein